MDIESSHAHQRSGLLLDESIRGANKTETIDASINTALPPALSPIGTIGAHERVGGCVTMQKEEKKDLAFFERNFLESRGFGCVCATSLYVDRDENASCTQTT